MLIGTFKKSIILNRSLSKKSKNIEEEQLRQLNELIKFSKQNVPLYRELYDGNNISYLNSLEEILELPFLTKSIIKANFPDRTVADNINHEALYSVSTSGTSDQVMLFQDEKKRDWDRSADLLLSVKLEHYRPMKRMIIPPDACYERCGLDAKSRQKTLSGALKDIFKKKRRQGIRSLIKQLTEKFVWRSNYVESLGIDGTAIDEAKVNSYFEIIRKTKPWVLNALPFYLFILAQKKPISINKTSIKVLRPSGGKATPFMIKKIEEGFGGRFRENYGTAELGTISFDCKYSRHQHLLSELFIIEFIRNGSFCKPGEVGELVITDLHNQAAPIIRYKVGDTGRYWDKPCPCGSNHLIFEVNGRMDETIVTLDGQVFTGDEVIDFFLAWPGVSFAKVIQNSDTKFVLEYVPEGQLKVTDDVEMSEKFSLFIGQQVEVRLRKVKRISPEPSGKYKLVLSCTYDRFHDKRKYNENTQGIAA